MSDLSASTAPRRLDRSRFYPGDSLLWTGIAGLALGTAVLCHVLRISIEGGSIQYLGGLAILAAGCLTRGFFPRYASVATLLETLAAFIILPAIFAPLSYAATRSPFPPIDAVLRATDLLAGFDAAQWHDVVASHPALWWINEAIYGSLVPQCILAIFILPQVGNGRQGFDLLRISALSLFIIDIITYFLPAIGTIPSHETWYADWLALRNLDEPFFTTASHVDGIVSFPSFHAAMGLILAYSLRGMGVLSWIFAALNGLMIVATPASGYHYLTDVVAGLAVAAGVIAAMRYRERHGAKSIKPIATPCVDHAL
jgi:membrane-associated phospholipid phosphatase